MDDHEIRRRRLRQYKQETGLKWATIAEMIGVQANYVSNVQRGEKALSGDMARVWEKALHRPRYWLDGIDGPLGAEKLTPDEYRVLGTYRALVSAPRGPWRDVLLGQLENTLAMIEKPTAKKRRR